MDRVQLALNVDDIEEAVAFYSRLFRAEPAKRRTGYANFALDEPALKLVLIENPGAGGSLNHLGVEVATAAEVVDATRRLAAAGLPTRVEDGTTCCYALQDKVWVTGPGGERWEVYTVLADTTDDRGEVTTMDDCCESSCCESTSCC
jgi:catechol 2,3-dioxygenase-like lactoylglutathione lyase family enzyme